MKKGFWFVSAFLMLLTIGCSGVLDEGDVGSVRVVIGSPSASASSFTPQVFQPLFAGGSAAIDKGVITLTKGSQRIDKNFDYTNSPIDLSITSLQVGNWNIYVALYDADGFKIYEGSSTVTIKKGVTSTASITVSAVTGNLEIIIDVPGPFLVLDENFDDGVANGWTLAQGIGTITNGEYHIKGVSGVPQMGGYLLYGAGNTALSNYVFEFDFKGVEGYADDLRPDVMFRIQSWGASYSLYRIDFFPMDNIGNPGYWSCAEYNGTWGTPGSISNGNSNLFVREWNHGEISVIGNLIRIYINGGLLLQYTDPTPMLYGGIGLATMWTTETVYDNVKLWLY
ncbi:MAG: hypothetical protein A2014_03510 [Spirochaetes bacterium GWF1_49_6]|nr:MAG: hypothetical protein A2014_03510 [Spirochaetes bacterium GWF1_49_6]